MAETMTKAPGICLTPREVKRELRRMDGFTPPGAEAPAVAHLTGIQLYEVERMAAQGMLLDQIAARLAIPADVFEAISQANPAVREAYAAGIARGQDVATRALFKNVREGDPGSIRYYLERLGGPQFRKQEGPAVVINNGPMVQIDQADMTRRFDRQAALLDGREIEGEAEPAP